MRGKKQLEHALHPQEHWSSQDPEMFGTEELLNWCLFIKEGMHIGRCKP
jgi:hypothetical protein